MTGDEFRKLALSLDDVSERPHFDRAAFRTPRRIFATLGATGHDANLKLELEQQAALVEAHPKAFAAIEGGWGRMGWTRVTLAALSPAEAKSVLSDAHALARAEPAKPAKARAPDKARAPAKPKAAKAKRKP